MQFIKVLPALALGVAASAGIFASGQATAEEKQRMATGTDMYMEAAFKQFDAHLAGCTKKTGYDPDNTAGLGPHAIAPGEEKWIACAYKGVETILIPATTNPVFYTTLIQTHKILTENIRRKASTREERKKQIEALVQGIQKQEAEILGTTAESPEKSKEMSQEQKTEWMRGMTDNLRMP